MTTTKTETPTLHLSRWTVTSGSQVQSRGAVVISSGDHQWKASAEGNGAVDALYRAVDRALAGVLTGHPRLLSYDVHAVAEGPDSEGVVTVRIAPPSAATGRRGTGSYNGEARSENIIAASVDAYIDAINRLLAEAHWAGAADSAGNRKRAAAGAAAEGRRAELDPDEGNHDTTAWFER
jgi:LeuA-like protein with dimerisation domain